jgi:type I restriction-modification system DNA methylase subunit
LSLFQKSILNSIKHDEVLIASRWNNFQNYLSKVQAIRGFKEEVYQDGFFTDIFVSCLGYTLKTTNPNDYNLEREKKNETDGKKADGVIYVNGEVIGIVELKDQKTKNLDAVESQAFNYHNSHSNSKYIIISNFDELRFYIDKKTAYEKFNLFSLSYEDFKTLHLLLSYESIRDDIPLKLKEKSANFEATISKQLYKDFSAFRTHLFENIVKNNDLDRLLLLRLTQKLCDRIIFILFAEDRGLLQANTVKEIRARHASDGFGDRSMYDYYKLYFNAINTGNDKLGIPKYNGGLFATDEMLDFLKIDDTYLDMEAQKLSDYDFESDISVNILGHIFEQSLTDLEELNASIENTDFDKKKSKRKKDGVFYTPEYITRYIVENTLGKLCSDKKAELKIEAETVVINPRKLTKAEQTYKEILLNYREWLTHLKILDPACGSGAFLNQALEFLIREHTLIRDLLLPYEDLMIGYEIEKSILEHNLYGVDINEDAVEIAKLSLWLRTAHKGRELTSLNDKIVCANSLLAMPFEEGSFDVVIGNPPYVRVQGLKSNYEDEAKLYEQKYRSATGKYDIYALFLEMSFKMLKLTGKLSYILPHKFLIADFGYGLRTFLAENRAVESLLHFGSEMVFEDASAYTCIVTLSHDNQKLNFKSIHPKKIFDEFVYDSMGYEKLHSDTWNLSNSGVSQVMDALNKQPLRLKEVFSKISVGVQSLGDDIYLLSGKFQDNNFIGFSKELNTQIILEKEIMKPFLKGDDVKRYAPLSAELYIIYPHFIDEKGKTKPLEEEDFKRQFPLAYNYLEEYKPLLTERKINYKTNPKYWYSLHRSREIEMFNQEKIITPEISFGANMSYDADSFFHGTTHYTFIKKDTFKESYKFYLTLLNSSLMWFFIQNTSTELRGGYFRFKTAYLEPFPLPKLDNLEQQEPFIEKADLMLNLTKQLQTAKQNFLNELHLEKIPQKLQNFEALAFDDFVKEYTKTKKLKFADKLEERNFKNDWSALFENDKKAVSELKAEIAKTDKEIDAMVYVLYGLSADEIGIVEGKK